MRTHSTVQAIEAGIGYISFDRHREGIMPTFDVNENIGIDIKSREEIIATILKQAEAGMSAIYLANDHEELVRGADRLEFFDGGQITSIVDNDGLRIDALLKIRDR